MRVKLVNYSNHSLTFNSILPISKLDIIMQFRDRLPSSAVVLSDHITWVTRYKQKVMIDEVEHYGDFCLSPSSSYFWMLIIICIECIRYPYLYITFITTTFHMLCSFACIITYWYLHHPSIIEHS